MTGVLVVPCWEHGKFFPHLFPDGRHAVDAVTGVMTFRTKMKQTRPFKSSCLLTDTFQTYILISFKGGDFNWKPKIDKQNCIMSCLLYTSDAADE